jgi:hypothetical protein
MPLSTNAANKILLLLLNGTAWANVADNAASSPATTLVHAAHTATPGVGGNQTTNESAASGYARKTTARSSGGYTITSNVGSPTSNISFNAFTGSGTALTDISLAISNTTSGAVNHDLAGAMSPSVTPANGLTMILTTASTITLT